MHFQSLSLLSCSISDTFHKPALILSILDCKHPTFPRMQFAQGRYTQLWATGVFPIKSHQWSLKRNTSCALALHQGKFCLLLPPCSVAESSQLPSLKMQLLSDSEQRNYLNVVLIWLFCKDERQKHHRGAIWWDREDVSTVHCQTKQCRPKVRSTYWAVSHDFLFVLRQMFTSVLWYGTVDLWKLQHSY